MADFVNGPADSLDGDETASKRLEIVEALITGNHLTVNPLIPTHEDGPCNLAKQLKSRQNDFWFHVGQFVTAMPQDTPEAAQAMRDREEGCLHKCRALLDHLESRDMLYSIMLMRHVGELNFGARLAEGQDCMWKDWTQASGYLILSSRGQATSLVMMRFASMALRLFIFPQP